jgi:putative ABC transport system substrate-binding protein
MQFDHLRRREFITLLGSAAATWPFAAHGQQQERMRHISIFFSIAETDADGKARALALRQGLQTLGWIEGHNLHIDYRWAGGNRDLIWSYAKELAALKPDLIVAGGATVMEAIVRETRTVPLVFAQVNDPVGAGFVASLAEPGGNATGFAGIDYSMSGKWLEILKEIAPRITRVAVFVDRQQLASAGSFGAMQAVAPLLGVTLVSAGVQDATEIEHVIGSFVKGSSDGLIVLPGPLATVHRSLIIGLAGRYQLPAIYPYRFFAASGGLVSYGVDNVDLYRRAASYVDRILKGEKPANLPVQAPTKYELVVNRGTAKALGFEIPPTLLARADEVIE